MQESLYHEPVPQPPIDVRSSVASSNADFSDDAMYKDQQPRMAKLISNDFMDIDAIEGREVSLEFTVEN